MKLSSLRRRRAAFTLVEVLVVCGVAVALTAMGIAGLNQQRSKAAAMACGNNLRLIQEAKRAALEEDPTLTDFSGQSQVAISAGGDSSALLPYLPNNQMPVCPGGGTYNSTNSVTDVATCSMDAGNSGAHNILLPGQTAPRNTLKPGRPVFIGPITTTPIEIQPD